MKKVPGSFSLSTAVLLTPVLLLIGCRADNPGITGPAAEPPPKIERVTKQATAAALTVQIDSRVDILFVVDDSASMRNHQKNLSRNIHLFVDEIAKVKAIDFHIGYTVVHDSSRYGVTVDRECGGKLNWEDPGTLKALKDSTGKLAKEGRRFVTSQDDFKKILRENLDPELNPDLIKPFTQKSDKNPCATGPEEEELFTPLLGAVDNPIVLDGANKGFRRRGALFVAILLSDAKDQSGISPEDVLSRLTTAVVTQQSNKRPRVFTVGFAPGTKYGTSVASHADGSCKPDPAWSNGMNGDRVVWPAVAQVSEFDNPLVNLARLTQDSASAKPGHVLSICESNFGEALAKFGTQIKQDALRDIVVPLGGFTQITEEQKNKLQVMLGDEVLVQSSPGKRGHWTHDVQNESVIIHAQNIDWSKYQNEKIRIVFTPASTDQTTQPAWRRR